MNMLRDLISRSAGAGEHAALITAGAYVMLGAALFLFVLSLFCLKDFFLRGGAAARGEHKPPFRASLLIGGIAAFALAFAALAAADALWACRVAGVGC